LEWEYLGTKAKCVESLDSYDADLVLEAIVFGEKLVKLSEVVSQAMEERDEGEEYATLFCLLLVEDCGDLTEYHVHG